jgi:AraC-like DNA-binding protein
MFTDCDGYQTNLLDLLDLVVPEPRAFRAHLTWLELPQISIMRSEETAARIAYLRLPPGRVFVSFATHRDTELIIPGAVLRYGDLALHGMGECLHQRTHAAASWGLLSLTPASLLEFNSAVTGQEFPLPAGGQVLEMRAADRQRLLRLHAQSCKIAETNLGRIENEELVRAIEQDLAWSLMTCLARSRARNRNESDVRLGQLAVRLEALLATCPQRSWQTKEILAQLGIPERTLQAVGKSLLGMTVRRYQRLRRLKLARASLLRSGRTGGDGTAAIRHFGYTDLSRFVADYWDAYGEMPPVPPRSTGGRG